MPRDMTLDDLAGVVGGLVLGDGSVHVKRVTHDSRQVIDGDLYVAIRGFQADGHDYVQAAIAAGARAVCVDHDVQVAVPQLVIEDTRPALGTLAAAAYGRPSEQFRLVGVTGTNGKTTVSHMLESILIESGTRTGIIGTIGARVSNGASGETLSIQLERTTPEASDLQDIFRQMVDVNVDVVVMEVSSHALALERLSGTSVSVAAFTNLSQDHLDFHADMEDYFAAKAKLFSLAPVAVVMTDTEAGMRMLDQIRPSADIVGVGSGHIDRSDANVVAEVTLESVQGHVDHSTFVMTIGTAGETVSRDVRLPVAGRFNVDNAMVAAGVAYALDISLDDIVRGLNSLAPVPGRFEYVGSHGGTDVVVDYAHTPDGVRNAVAAGRSIAQGRVVAVVGAGGDRDQAKRPLMGEAASAADVVYVTSDNPRSEDPAVIVDEVVAGVRPGTALFIEVDRRHAIEQAIQSADSGDLVMILGKGHEQGQEVAGEVVPFDDRIVARSALEARS